MSNQDPISYLTRAIRIFEQTLSPQHPDVAFPLTGLANLYSKQGRYAEAEPLYQRALRIREQALGPEHPHTRATAKSYAFLLRTMGRGSEAEHLEAKTSEGHAAHPQANEEG